MIREIQERDRAWLKSKQWQFGADFAGGLVYQNEDDIAVLAVGAWKRAEVHFVANADWSTPGARDAALGELHEALRVKLLAEGCGEVYTFFDRIEATCRRLKKRGWSLITKQVWGRSTADV